ncbi:hypothetical protein AAMO2058_000605200 [Amorphochlora amoebiformis]
MVFWAIIPAVAVNDYVLPEHDPERDEPIPSRVSRNLKRGFRWMFNKCVNGNASGNDLSRESSEEGSEVSDEFEIWDPEGEIKGSKKVYLTMRQLRLLKQAYLEDVQKAKEKYGKRKGDRKHSEDKEEKISKVSQKNKASMENKRSGSTLKDEKIGNPLLPLARASSVLNVHQTNKEIRVRGSFVHRSSFLLKTTNGDRFRADTDKLVDILEKMENQERERKAKTNDSKEEKEKGDKEKQPEDIQRNKEQKEEKEEETFEDTTQQKEEEKEERINTNAKPEEKEGKREKEHKQIANQQKKEAKEDKSHKATNETEKVEDMEALEGIDMKHDTDKKEEKQEKQHDRLRTSYTINIEEPANANLDRVEVWRVRSGQRGLKKCFVEIKDGCLICIDESSIKKAQASRGEARVLGKCYLEQTRFRHPSKTVAEAKLDESKWKHELSLDIQTKGSLLSFCFLKEIDFKRFLVSVRLSAIEGSPFGNGPRFASDVVGPPEIPPVKKSTNLNTPLMSGDSKSLHHTLRSDSVFTDMTEPPLLSAIINNDGSGDVKKPRDIKDNGPPKLPTSEGPQMRSTHKLKPQESFGESFSGSPDVMRIRVGKAPPFADGMIKKLTRKTFTWSPPSVFEYPTKPSFSRSSMLSNLYLTLSHWNFSL